jgi:ubiquinone/menaquinone biosynthesis C-methylase UbiE
MTTDYDPIAEQYQRAKQQPWRTYVECFTLLDLVGDLGGLTVLDLACGDGFYTRLLRRRGALRATGVDLSPRMIELAREQEIDQRLGIEYLVGNAKELHLAETYDLAAAAYLLNYAHDYEELSAMCRGIAARLAPGGRFVTVNANPACDFWTAPSYRPYGFEVIPREPRRDGSAITWTFHLDDGPLSIENYFLDRPAHEQALGEAGFREIRWHQPRRSPNSVPSESEHWRSLLEHPPFTFLECLR